MAAVGTLAAVMGSAASGRGQHLDVSNQEAMMGLERVEIARLANDPNPPPRAAGRRADRRPRTATS